MTERFIAWCDRVNPQSESENMVIRYGLELLVENSIKLLLLLLAGFFIGRGVETLIFLLVFCSIRIQAGGFHANTGWGCGLCMAAVWIMGMLGDELIEISSFFVLILLAASVFTIIWQVPNTRNRHCYTLKMIKRKKIVSIALIGGYAVTSMVCREWRSLILSAVALEVITLLPFNKTHNKGG